jgi:fructuronate reductase
MRWQDGPDETGAAHVVDDPLASETARLIARTLDTLERAAALLWLEAVFPKRLATDPRFTAPVMAAYVRLSSTGARAAAAWVVKGET